MSASRRVARRLASAERRAGRLHATALACAGAGALAVVALLLLAGIPTSRAILPGPDSQHPALASPPGRPPNGQVRPPASGATAPAARAAGERSSPRVVQVGAPAQPSGPAPTPGQGMSPPAPTTPAPPPATTPPGQPLARVGVQAGPVGVCAELKLADVTATSCKEG